jgi:TatD DNase family protein
MAELTVAAAYDNVLAIGECGLDKVCDTPWDIQEAAFRQQVLLANRLSKPLMIHCVRAFNELDLVLKELDNIVPVIIHGFNKNPALAAALLAKGYYLSFGAALLRTGSPAASSLIHTPADRMLLETDDSGSGIKDIYLQAAQLLKTGEEDLILQIDHNFKTVFNRS